MQQLLPIRGGLVTLEKTNPPSIPGDPATASHEQPRMDLQVTFWSAALPQARLHELVHDKPVRTLDLAADGLLVSGGDDQQVSVHHPLKGAG